MWQLIIKRLLKFPIQILIITFLLYFISVILPILVHEVNDSISLRWFFTNSFEAPYGIFYRYFSWIRNILFYGDFGRSLINGEQVIDVISPRVIITTRLLSLSFILLFFIGIPVGILSTFKKSKLFEKFVNFIVISSTSLPIFTIGFLLILLFAFNLRWLPFTGTFQIGVDVEALNFWQIQLIHLTHTFLPALTLALSMLFIPIKLLNTNINQTKKEIFINLVRAKGASQFSILKRHILKKDVIMTTIAILPMIVTTGLTGTIVVERLFSYRGLGELIFNSFLFNDLLVVKSIIILFATVILFVTLICDILLLILDPRVRI